MKNLDVLTFISKVNKLENKKIKLLIDSYNEIPITDNEGFLNIFLNCKLKT